MMSVPLSIETKNGIASVLLNRPDRRNAIDADMARSLTDAFTAFGRDPSLRAVLVSGAGSAFCAGADLHWLGVHDPPTAQQARRDADLLMAMFRAIDECSCPVIGRIHGAAFGGGVGLVGLCDIAVAREDATFALSEVRLGLMPAVIAPFLLRKTGESFLRRFCLTGEPFSAATARQFNLVHEVLPGRLLDRRIAEVLDAVSGPAPQTVRRTKAFLRRLGSVSQADLWEVCIETNADARLSDEAREGLRAFKGRRAPLWNPEPPGAPGAPEKPTRERHDHEPTP